MLTLIRIIGITGTLSIGAHWIYNNPTSVLPSSGYVPPPNMNVYERLLLSTLLNLPANYLVYFFC